MASQQPTNNPPMMMIQANPPHQPADDKAPGDSARRLRVLIADRDGLARNMMQAALQDTAIVLTAANAREALALTRYYHPTVAIIDTALPPNGSVELIGQLLATAPHTQILTVSIDDQPQAIAGLRAGAIGHITKDTNPDHLASLITKAANGDTIIPPPLTKALLQLAREIPDAGWRPLHSRLTTREWEIAELLRDNTTTRQIADRLVLAPTTVHSHIKNLLRKLDVHSRHDAYPAARRLRQTEVWNQTPPPTPTPQAPQPPTKKH